MVETGTISEILHANTGRVLPFEKASLQICFLSANLLNKKSLDGQQGVLIHVEG
jgi:hypothetical protein